MNIVNVIEYLVKIANGIFTRNDSKFESAALLFGSDDDTRGGLGNPTIVTSAGIPASSHVRSSTAGVATVVKASSPQMRANRQRNT